jgi:hypothetical protein
LSALGIMFQPSEAAPAAAASQPLWMIYTAFAVSVALAIIRLIEFIRAQWSKAELAATLTRDLFFRFGEVGETLFLNAVLTSSQRPAFIHAVTASLSRVDGTHVIPLRLEHLGEPADRGSTIHDHYFFSSSPTDLIPVDTPTRRVLMLVVESNTETLQAAYRTLMAATAPHLAFARQIATTFGNQPIPEPQQGQLSAAIGAISAAREAFVNQYFDAIQLQSGTYRANVTWHFRDAKKATSASREQRSSVSFVLPPDFRQRLRDRVREAGDARIRQEATGDAKLGFFPEVRPEQISVVGP